jgi:DNA-binding MarR family transcriptional regulator
VNGKLIPTTIILTTVVHTNVVVLSLQYYIPTFVALKDSNKAGIRTRFVIGYSEMLVKVRRGTKGLRLGYLFSIQIIGENTGLRLCDLAEITGRDRTSLYHRIKRVENAGFITKTARRYYLTDSGRAVYNTICKEFDASMKEIIAYLVREAAKKSG